MADWYDDPCFDDTQVTVDGRVLRGNDWRRWTFLKEQAKRNNKDCRLVAVAGTTFRDGTPKRRCVQVIAEPDNTYDRNAKRVHVDNVHVGYIPRGEMVAPDAHVNLVKCGVRHVWLAVEA